MFQVGKTLVVLASAAHTLKRFLGLGIDAQADLCEFEVHLLYVVSSRTAKARQRDLLSKEYIY